MPDRRRLRVTVDYIIEGPELTQIQQQEVGHEVYSMGQAVAFQDLKENEVVIMPAQTRVVYTHYHDSDEEGGYCREGCLEHAQDTHNQEDVY